MEKTLFFLLLLALTTTCLRLLASDDDENFDDLVAEKSYELAKEWVKIFEKEKFTRMVYLYGRWTLVTYEVIHLDDLKDVTPAVKEKLQNYQPVRLTAKNFKDGRTLLHTKDSNGKTSQVLFIIGGHPGLRTHVGYILYEPSHKKYVWKRFEEGEYISYNSRSEYIAKDRIDGEKPRGDAEFANSKDSMDGGEPKLTWQMWHIRPDDENLVVWKKFFLDAEKTTTTKDWLLTTDPIKIKSVLNKEDPYLPLSKTTSLKDFEALKKKAK